MKINKEKLSRIKDFDFTNEFTAQNLIEHIKYLSKFIQKECRNYEIKNPFYELHCERIDRLCDFLDCIDDDED